LKYRKVNRELIFVGVVYFLSIIRGLRLFFKYNKVYREMSFGEVIIF